MNLSNLETLVALLNKKKTCADYLNLRFVLRDKTYEDKLIVFGEDQECPSQIRRALIRLTGSISIDRGLFIWGEKAGSLPVQLHGQEFKDALFFHSDRIAWENAITAYSPHENTHNHVLDMVTDSALIIRTTDGKLVNGPAEKLFRSKFF